MYPYILIIIADGISFTTRHKTYGEALAMLLELESKFGKIASIRMSFQEQDVVAW
ncbi:hypothetical protein [Spirosoma sp. KNUC1025]|uniref:hypothetical protein n=1 Tax=Spirosoma sp. KNUC1025 TaxID=2894082 RepID=UPI00386BF9A7|nr:hypothetical protein LN737_09595 [Spirosoma sp. KNUC1025]